MWAHVHVSAVLRNLPTRGDHSLSYLSKICLAQDEFYSMCLSILLFKRRIIIVISRCCWEDLRFKKITLQSPCHM